MPDWNRAFRNDYKEPEPLPPELAAIVAECDVVSLNGFKTWKLASHRGRIIGLVRVTICGISECKEGVRAPAIYCGDAHDLSPSDSIYARSLIHLLGIDLRPNTQRRCEMDSTERGTTQPSFLPEGWTESAPGRMATNPDPERGGIVDEAVNGRWFVIPERAGIGAIDGQPTRDAAFAALRDALNALDQHAAMSSETYHGVTIYPTLIKGFGARWAVQQGDRPATGDTLHQRIEEARAEVDHLLLRREDTARREAHAAAERAAQESAARAKAADDINGFIAGMDPMRAGRVRKALEKQFRFADAGVLTVRARVEALHQTGELAVETVTEPKIKPLSRTRFNRASLREQIAHERRMKEAGERTVYLVNGSELGKTAYDYATCLQAQNAKPDPEPAGARTPAENLNILKRFLGEPQRRILKSLLTGEEGAHFAAILSEYAERISTMPKTYQTDGQGDDAMVHLHYFRGNGEWFIIETDQEEEQLQTYGYADLGGGGECGYINIEELCANGVELDLYFEPKPLREIKAHNEPILQCDRPKGPR